MICLFNNKATKEQLMTTNGDYILDNICTKSIISEKINEDFSCQFTFELDKEYPNEINAIVEDAILRVEDEEGEECFRIVNIVKNTNYIDVFAVHITIRDIINMWCEDVRPTNKSGQGALTWIFDNAEGGHNFNVTSNISNINTSYYESVSVYNALYGADNSFINKWGGETSRRGFNIAINDKIGMDRGMQIRSAKNIEGFESKTNLDQLCTVLYVKGFDGIKLDTPVVSPLLNNYSKPYYKEIKFDDIKVKNANNPDEGYDTLALAQAEMLRRGQEQFSKYNIDVIKATYNVNFVQLEKTEEYKAYSMIETAFLGDTVEVIEDNYNINIKVRVTERKYNVFKKERIETTLSNIDIKSKPVKVEDLIKELEKEMSGETRPNLSAYIDAMINSGIKDSYVTLKPNELLIMDTKDINTAINVCRYNKNGMGFSQTGYFGTYEYGFTIDGKINASMISTGVLLADLIKAGILKSFNNLTWINMDDGTFNFGNKLTFNGSLLEMIGDFKQISSTGRTSVEIKNNQVIFYDYLEGGHTNAISSMTAVRYKDGAVDSDPGTSWLHKKYSLLSLGYEETDGTYSDYVKFDNDKMVNNQQPIEFFKNAHFWERLFITLSLTVPNIYTSRIDTTVSPDNCIFANPTGAGWVVNRSLLVNGDLAVVGAKNCMQETINYGKRLFYSVEDGQSFLTETGEGNLSVLKTLDNTFERVVLINEIYKECVDLERHYIIEINKVGWGDYRIKEQTKDYFILESDREDFIFNYCIKAKRKGYEDVSLEEYISVEGETTNEITIN